VEALLVRYGLLAVVLGAAVEGDISIVMAGVVAHLGFFPPRHAVTCAALGAFLGDCAWYWLGRSHAATVRATRVYTRAAPVIERLAARLGPWEIVLARFVYGARIASMFFWGVHGLGFVRFAALDALGCALSASVLVGLGYALSGGAVALVGRVRRAERWLAVFLVVTVALALTIRALFRRAARAR